MKTISIKQLHASTGRWIRSVNESPIVVTDRGERVAILKPFSDEEVSRPVFKGRRWSQLPSTNVDATQIISDDRDRS